MLASMPSSCLILWLPMVESSNEILWLAYQAHLCSQTTSFHMNYLHQRTGQHGNFLVKFLLRFRHSLVTLVPVASSLTCQMEVVLRPLKWSGSGNDQGWSKILSLVQIQTYKSRADIQTGLGWTWSRDKGYSYLYWTNLHQRDQASTR